MKLNKIIMMGCLSVMMITSVNADVVNTEEMTQIENQVETIATDEVLTDDAMDCVTTLTAAEETKLRETPSPTGDIIEYLNRDEEVKVWERYGGFYKVTTTEGTTGYIYKTQLDITNLGDVLDATPVVNIEEDASLSKGKEIVATAKKYLGGKYVYGGNNLATGVDCSGFVQQVMKLCGIQVERSSKAQYASSGVKISIDEVQPGDLVFYGSDGVNVNHVAIYAGDNQIVHASSARTGIKMSKLYYGKPIIGVKRVTN